MDNEQATVASAQETASEQNSATTDENKPVEQEKPVNKPAEQTWKTPLWKAPTKEEYDKTIQSTASKAKYDILQELGITSVNDFKTKSDSVNKALSETSALKTENEHLKEDLICKDLQVDDAYKDDLLTLVKAKTTDSKDFKTVAEEVLNKNPNWKVARPSVKIGIEKSEKNDTSTVESRLAEKYDWLK